MKKPVRSTQNSPLVTYALRGLEKCWLSDHGRWSHIYHLDGRDPPNESRPESDTFYTLNVLLGLSRVPQIPRNIDLRDTFNRSALNLLSLPVQKYAYGVALWASAELDINLPTAVLDKIDLLISDKRNWLKFKAQDLGMILMGVSAQASKEPKRWSPIAHELFDFLRVRFCNSSGLFFNDLSHFRRRFASFAAQTYLTLASYSYGEAFNKSAAIDLANACTRKLIQLQGPNGEWPWFFDAINGKILDFYEVYTVHQCGMAPAFLELAERHGLPEARHALVKGFHWALGNNQLMRSMLVPELNLTIRSQARKRELDTKIPRMIRSMRNSVLARSATLADPAKLMMRPECRSYELGWILWSFGRRTDLPELTNHHTLIESLGSALSSGAAALAEDVGTQ